MWIQALLLIVAVYAAYQLYQRHQLQAVIRNSGQLAHSGAAGASHAGAVAMDSVEQVGSDLHDQVSRALADNYDSQVDDAEQAYSTAVHKDQLNPYNTKVLSYPQPSQGYSELGEAAYTGMSCFPRDQLKASELLPQEGGGVFDQVVPKGQGDVLHVNLIEAGQHLGINTVGSHRGVANYQIRSDPPIVKKEVGPWNQSTSDPDTSHLTFEIGSC